MTASGIDGQLVIVDEVTYGTYVAPTRAYEFTTENFKFEIERIESAGLRAGRRIQHRWAPGIQRVSGGFEMEFPATSSALFLNHVFGLGVIAGADPYTHTYDGTNSLDGTSFTMQVGKPDLAGTVQPFSYLGCKVTEAEFSANVNEYLMLKPTIYAGVEDTTETLVTATYATGLDPFVFTEGVLTIAASEICVRDFSFTVNNNLAVDRHFVCASGEIPKEPVENGLQEITGSFTADFEDLVQYNRYVNGTEAAMVLTFTQGTDTFVVTMNTRFDGSTPNVSGPELLELPVEFRVVGTVDGSDAAAFTAVLTNGDAAA
jgi:hypothetical protein